MKKPIIDWKGLAETLLIAANDIFARYTEDDTHVIETGETLKSASDEIKQMLEDPDWRG